MSQKLIDVRCPRQLYGKSSGKMFTCNHLYGRYYPGSGGELKCRHCGLKFYFKIDDQANSIIGIKVMPINNEENKNNSIRVTFDRRNR